MRISDWSSDVCSSDLSKGVASPALKSALAPPLDYIEGANKTHSKINELAGGGASPAMTHPCVTSYDAPLRHSWQSIYILCPIYCLEMGRINRHPCPIIDQGDRKSTRMNYSH